MSFACHFRSFNGSEKKGNLRRGMKFRFWHWPQSCKNCLQVRKNHPVVAPKGHTCACASFGHVTPGQEIDSLRRLGQKKFSVFWKDSQLQKKTNFHKKSVQNMVFPTRDSTNLRAGATGMREIPWRVPFFCHIFMLFAVFFHSMNHDHEFQCSLWMRLLTGGAGQLQGEKARCRPAPLLEPVGLSETHFAGPACLPWRLFGHQTSDSDENCFRQRGHGMKTHWVKRFFVLKPTDKPSGKDEKKTPESFPFLIRTFFLWWWNLM